MTKLYEKIGDCTPDNLIAGHEVPVLLKGVALASGQGVVKRGTVLGIVTANGKGKVVDKTVDPKDGTETAYGILADDVDTTAADITAQVYTSGLFNRKALIFAENNTAADHEETLRGLGINIAY